MRRIVVGVDGSEQATAALRWSAGVARRTGAALDVVTVGERVMLVDPFSGAWALDDLADEQVDAAQQSALDAVDLDGIEVSTVRQMGQPASVLVGRAEGADLLVVGTHGHGLAGSVLLGSVSRQAVAHASCPVVAVPEVCDPPARIVVGVDGSEPALHALRWAVELARVLDASVEVVTVVHHAVTAIGAPWVPSMPAPTITELREAAEQLLDDVVGRADAEDVVVERTVMEGSAPDRLAARAQDADLLVVGSRGHGGFAGLMLGSVSSRCLTHAHRPVVVVPSG